MAEYWQAMHLRGQQTIGVWGTFAPTFQVGPLTLAAHTADVALILTHVDERNVQQDVLDEAVLARDANFDLIHDIVVRVPQLIDAVLEDSDPLNNDLDDIFGVNPDSQHGSRDELDPAMASGRRRRGLRPRHRADRHRPDSRPLPRRGHHPLPRPRLELGGNHRQRGPEHHAHLSRAAG